MVLHSAGPGGGKPQIFTELWLATLSAVGQGMCKQGSLGCKRASWDQCAGLSPPPLLSQVLGKVSITVLADSLMGLGTHSPAASWPAWHSPVPS